MNTQTAKREKRPRRRPVRYRPSRNEIEHHGVEQRVLVAVAIGGNCACCTAAFAAAHRGVASTILLLASLPSAAAEC